MTRAMAIRSRLTVCGGGRRWMSVSLPGLVFRLPYNQPLTPKYFLKCTSGTVYVSRCKNNSSLVLSQNPFCATLKTWTILQPMSNKFVGETVLVMLPLTIVGWLHTLMTSPVYIGCRTQPYTPLVIREAFCLLQRVHTTSGQATSI